MRKITITLLLIFSACIAAHAQVPLLTGVSGVTGPTGTTGATYVSQEDGTGDIGIGMALPFPVSSGLYGCTGCSGVTGYTGIGFVLGVGNESNNNTNNVGVIGAGNVTSTCGDALGYGTQPFSIAALRVDPACNNNSQIDFSVDYNGQCGIGMPAAYFNPYILASGWEGSLLGVIDPNSTGTTPLLTVVTNTNNPLGLNLAALTVDYKGYLSLGGYFPLVGGSYGNPSHLFLTDPTDGTDALMDVVTGASGGYAQSLYIAYNGSVGIGTSSPASGAALDVQGGVLRIGDVTTPSPMLYSGTGSGTTGTDFNGYGLYVQYGVLAESFKCAGKTTTDWSDYVFDKGYELKPLSEVETYIKANHHLPGVPSADDVRCDGVDMVKMDATLLKKIEELTLYMLELKKDNEAIKKDNATMKAQLSTVKKHSHEK